MSHLGCWPSTINFDWDFFFLFFPNNFSNIESTANSSLSVHIWKIQKLGLFLLQDSAGGVSLMGCLHPEFWRWPGGKGSWWDKPRYLGWVWI